MSKDIMDQKTKDDEIITDKEPDSKRICTSRLLIFVIAILSIAILVGVCVAVLFEENMENMKQDNSTTGKLLTISITVESQVSSDTASFTATHRFDETNTLFDILQDLQDSNPNFNFTYKEFTGLGPYITAINGVSENPADKTYWAIYRRNADNQDCYLTLGISSYVPMNGDHIVFSLQSYDHAGMKPCPPKVSFQFSIESGLSNSDFNINITNYRKDFFSLMEDTATSNSQFQFEFKIFAGLGVYVTSINNLAENITGNMYWAFMKQLPSGYQCSVDKGVSTYMPEDGDHILFKYVNWEHDNIPICPPKITIKFSIYNLMTNRILNASLSLDTYAQPFFYIMKTAAKLDPMFQFDYKEYPSLGVYVTSINGMSADDTQKTYWAFMRKTGSEEPCFIQQGVSSYVPFSDEHLIFDYRSYNESNHGTASPCPEQVVLTYNIVNEIKEEDNFSVFRKMYTYAIPFIKVMEQAAIIDPTFKFEFKIFAGLGVYVTSINNLAENITGNMYWAFMKQLPSGYQCSVDKGVSTYMPEDGDHILFKYVNWEHDNIPICPSKITIKFSIYNLMTNRILNASLSLDTYAQPFFYIMKTAAKLDPMFQFDYKEYPSLGVYVTSINGMSADDTQKTYWAFMRKTGSEEPCFIQQGVSSYMPFSDEHLIFDYRSYNESNHGTASPCPDQVVLTYVIVNEMKEDNFNVSLKMYTYAIPFIKVMEQAAELDPTFKFSSNSSINMPHGIFSVNGVEQDELDGLSWVLTKMNATHDCLVNSGLEEFIAADGDHIIFELKPMNNQTVFC